MSDRMTIKGPKAIEHGFVSKVGAPGNVREEITPGTVLIIENTVMLMISMIFTSYERNTARGPSSGCGIKNQFECHE